MMQLRVKQRIRRALWLAQVREARKAAQQLEAKAQTQLMYVLWAQGFSITYLGTIFQSLPLTIQKTLAIQWKAEQQAVRHLHQEASTFVELLTSIAHD